MRTDITIVLDESGSMQKIKADMEGALAAALEDQKRAPGQCAVTLVTFSNARRYKFTAMDLAKVPEIRLFPVGSTALYDAVCKTIDDTGDRLRRMPSFDRPDRVMFIIITDGEENASMQFKVEDVRDRINHQSAVYKWHFSYLGANHDAITGAARLGIPPQYAATYASTPGIGASMRMTLARSMFTYRAAPDGVLKSLMAFTGAERMALEEPTAPKPKADDHLGALSS